ncbi:unnamed protein product, partial [Scytosiphon promiscuus]
DDLSGAVKEAVRDYVELRGLKGLCSDVKKWSAPPGPAAFLDAGLPKTRGVGSLPVGLTASCKPVGGAVPYREPWYRKKDTRRSFTSHSGRYDRRSSLGSVNGSIPSPTWQAEGPEGSVSQVLSFDTIPAPAVPTPEIPGVDWDDKEIQVPTTEVVKGKSMAAFMQSSSSPELSHGRAHLEGLFEGGITPMDGKQTKQSCLEVPTRSSLTSYICRDATSPFAPGGARTSRSSRRGRGAGGKIDRRAASATTATTRSGAGVSRSPFSPADAWDDTGLFTVAPRPKTVPLPSRGSATKRSRLSEEEERRRQRPTLVTHALASPVFANHGWPSSFPPVDPPDAVGSSGGAALVGTIAPSELWHKGQDFGTVGRVGSGAASDGFGLWPKRRRKAGGGAGDQAVEFLDVREAALVSVTEALARRALPWQAQLCPRALQDLEVARVFHAFERKRQAECKARQDELLREKLCGEERSWKLFGDAQGRLFEGTLDQVPQKPKVQGRSSHASLPFFRVVSKNCAKQSMNQGQSRRSMNGFEQSEADRVLLYRRSSQVDLLWDPAATISVKKARREICREEERATAAWETWSKADAFAGSRLDASIWLNAVGARAFTSEEHARWRRGVTTIAKEDGSRAEADRACERKRSSESYSAALQTLWELDRTEMAVSGESWNLQGWLSVGSHKLVQQILRALVRRYCHPYEVRNVLWEARRAAEFAAAARGAAASQLCDDCRSLCKRRRDRRRTVRDHKRDLHLAEERRASAEDAERNRISHDTVERLLGTLAATKRDDMHGRLEEERTRVLSARKTEIDRSALFRTAMEGLQYELDGETERLAALVRERREEETRQILSEVSFAESALKEEQARADDREALLRETMLMEREKEDRFLDVWLRQQEREGRKEVGKQLQKARQHAAEERVRWINDIKCFMSESSITDAAFLRSPGAWKSSSTDSFSSNAVTSGQKTTGNTLIRENFPSDRLSETDGSAEGKVAENPTQFSNNGTVYCGLTSPSAPEVLEAHHGGVSRLQDEEVVPLEEVDHGGGDDDDFVGAGAGAAGAAADIPREGTLDRVNNKTNISNSYSQRLTAAAQAEHLAARKRDTRLESLASLARRGLAAHWEAFFLDEIERTRMAAAASDMAAERWAQHQQEAAEAFWGPWRSKDWEPTSFAGGSKAEASIGAAGQPRALVAAGKDDVASGGDAGSTRATGTGPERQRQSSGRSAHQDSEDKDGGRCEVLPEGTSGQSTVIKAGMNSHPREGNNTPNSAHSTPSDTEPAPAVSQMVVFVGGSMAFHLSTVRECHMEHFNDTNRRRCSSYSMPLQQGQSGQRWGCIVSSTEEADKSLDHAQEAGWLRALESLVEENETMDLAQVGSALVSLPGGAAVLCLAHDCLVQDPGETEGFVRTDLLLSATSAFITLRRSLRAAAETTAVATAAAAVVAEGGASPVAPVFRDMRKPSTAAAEAAARIGGTSARDRSNHQAAAATAAVIAEMEVAAELNVYDEELCIDLARIPSLSASGTPFATGGNNTGVGCSSKSQPTTRPESNGSNQTWHIWRAVKKQSAVLSPQTICALTALLSAKLQAWVHHSNASHGHDRDNLDFDNEDDHGGETSSPAGDPTAWEAALRDALLAVRTASLQHLALWADACDPDRLISACVAEVSATKSARHSAGDDAGEPGMKEVKALDSDKIMRGDGRSGEIGATWAALHKASGIGLSPLLLLAATLPGEAHSYVAAVQPPLSNIPHEVTGEPPAVQRVETPVMLVRGDGVGTIGDDGKADFTTDAVRTALRLLSPTSLLSMRRCVSGRVPDSPAAETAAAGPILPSDERNDNLADGTPEKEAGILLEIPGHPAIGDLSSLDAATLEKVAAGLMAALDVSGTGALPPRALAVALQSGEAGFRLEPCQAEVVLLLAGETTAPVAFAGLTTGPQTAKEGGGANSTSDSLARVPTTPYAPLVKKLPGLLQLVQAAYRTVGAATTTTEVNALHLITECEARRLMDGNALDHARRVRFRSGIERNAEALSTALESVCQRMAYKRLQHRASMLEGPRIAAMQQRTTDARQRASGEDSTRAIEVVRRAEIRENFTAATKDWVSAVNVGGKTMLGVRRARDAAASELRAAVDLATSQAQDHLVFAVERLSAIMVDAERELMETESSTRAADMEAREELNEEPDWWGEGLRQQIEESFRQEALSGQNIAETLLEEANVLRQSMGDTWEDDARRCKDAFVEIEKRLDEVIAEFGEKRAASTEVAGSAVRGAKSPSTLSSSPSSLQPEKKQADFADQVQMRHRGINICRESLSWLGHATHELEAECAELCERCSGLQGRMAVRLSAVLKTAEARVIEERSVVVRRLHAGSKSWVEEILQRERRWGSLLESRRTSFERTRASREAEQETSGRLGPVASAARTVVLAQALHMAREPVARFLEDAGNGPFATTAIEVSKAAAAALPRAHDTVQSIIAGRGGLRQDVGVQNVDAREGRGEREPDGTLEPTIPANAKDCVPGSVMRGAGKVEDGAGSAGAKDVLAVDREDSALRASACRSVVEEWWERQRVAVEEGLRDREQEAARRRTRREVGYLLQGSVVTEIEARHDAEVYGKEAQALVLREAKRIAEQFVEALRSATACVNDGATDAQAAVTEEGEVLVLEARSLSAQVSATLQRGLNTATEDLASAQRKDKKAARSTPGERGAREAE